MGNGIFGRMYGDLYGDLYVPELTRDRPNMIRVDTWFTCNAASPKVVNDAG